MKVYRTSKNTDDRLTFIGEINFSEDIKGEEGKIVNIYDEVSYREIIGFGGAITEAVTTTVDKLSDDLRKEILEAYFDVQKGIGYSLCRTHMNSCDFSLGNYTYVEDNDTDLSTFDISREKKSLIPFIKEAKARAGNDFLLYFSPWSPPAWMKTSGTMNRGGELLPEYYPLWAEYYVKYISEMKKQGIDFFALTVQNEPKAVQPWDSCVYTPEKERDFVKYHLGPALEKAGMSDVGIMVWDHNKERLFDWANVSLSDPETNKYLYGAGFHWYSGDHFESIEALNSLYPDKKWIFTEGCKEGGVKTGNWSAGEFYAHDIMGNLNHHANGYTDWNIVLDETGGPNHVMNLCDAPIIADTQNNKLYYKNSYYYIGHFSKFIRPGAVRIACTRYTDMLETIAFKNKDGSIVSVVLNRNSENIEFTIRYKGRLAKTHIPEHSIMTFIL